VTDGAGPDAKRPPLVAAALWGASTMVIAYLLSFGSVTIFIINIFVIAIGLRLIVGLIARRRGTEMPPRWWL
jgi:hypothetical protein